METKTTISPPIINSIQEKYFNKAMHVKKKQICSYREYTIRNIINIQNLSLTI